jgi:hypothetical protein
VKPEEKNEGHKTHLQCSWLFAIKCFAQAMTPVLCTPIMVSYAPSPLRYASGPKLSQRNEPSSMSD